MQFRFVFYLLAYFRRFALKVEVHLQLFSFHLNSHLEINLMWNGNMRTFIAIWKPTSALLHFDLKSETRHSGLSLRNANFWNESDQQYLVYCRKKAPHLNQEQVLTYITEGRFKRNMCKWNEVIFIKRSKQNPNHYSVTSKMQTSWGHYSDNCWLFVIWHFQ